MEEDLISRLLADSSVSAQVGSRVVPNVAPTDYQGPYIVMQVISDNPDHHAQGPGLDRARIQLDSYARTYANAKTTARAARDSLDGFIGTMGSTTVLYIAYDSHQDIWEDDAQMHRVSMDFIVTTRSDR